MGADCVTSARGFMFALGCVQALQCDKNSCPAGITTHNKKLQRGLVPEDKAERVMYYRNNMLKEVSLIAHACGLKDARELSRKHVCQINSEGVSVPMNVLHPEKSGSSGTPDTPS